MTEKGYDGGDLKFLTDGEREKLRSPEFRARMDALDKEIAAIKRAAKKKPAASAK